MSGLRPLLIIVQGMLVLPAAHAQQVTVGVPQHTVGDSYFESLGTQWGMRGDNWFFTFGGNPLVTPGIGDFDPNAGANLGWTFRRGDTSGFFNFGWAQGSRSSMVGQTPMLTLSNGVPGFFADTSLSPFVISYIPVAGGFPAFGALTPRMPMYSLPPVSPLDQALWRMQNEPPSAPASAGRPKQAALPRHNDRVELTAAVDQPSSAARPAMSVADARRLHERDQATAQTEAQRLFDRGLAAEREGKPAAARLYYQMAAKNAGGSLFEQIQARLRALATPPSESRR